MTNIIPKDLDEAVVDLLTGPDNQTICTDLKKEFLTAEIIKKLKNTDSFDATYIECNQYGELIKKALEISPYHIILPVGSGEPYNCFYNYITEKKLFAKLVDVIPQENHPLSSKGNIEKTLADKLYCKFMNQSSFEKIKKMCLMTE